MGFIKSLIADKSNWAIAAGAGFIYAFAINAYLQGDSQSAIYATFGVSMLLFGILVVSYVLYKKKQKNGNQN